MPSILLLSVLVAVQPASSAMCEAACTCLPVQAVADYAHRAELVFVGTVRRVRDNPRDAAAQSLVTFEVDSVWKGEVGRTVQIATYKEESVCGYRFRVGTEYLVYGEDADEPRVSSCSGTKPTESAYADLRHLGAPAVRHRVVQESRRRASS